MSPIKSPSLQGKFSVIGIENPLQPKFIGMVDSATLLSYPLKSYFPLYLLYGVVNDYRHKRVQCFNDKMLILQNNGVLYRYKIEKDTLDLMDVQKMHGKTIQFIRDSTILIDYETIDGLSFGMEFNVYPIKLSTSGFLVYPECNVGYNDVHAMYEYYQQGIINFELNDKIFISTNTITKAYSVGDTYRYPQSSSLIIYDLPTGIIKYQDAMSTCANSVNTGIALSGTEYLCTTIGKGDYDSDYYQQNTATELFVSNSNSLNSYDFAVLHNGVYRDTVHKKNQLKNIILDTLSQKVYLIFDNNLTILSYEKDEINSLPHQPYRSVYSHGLIIRPTAAGTTIILPKDCINADLDIFDVSGRIIEKFKNITTNAIVFHPHNKSMKSYIAVVKKAGRIYAARMF